MVEETKVNDRKENKTFSFKEWIVIDPMTARY